MEKFPEIGTEMYGKWSRMLEEEGLKAKQGKESRVVEEIMEMRQSNKIATQNPVNNITETTSEPDQTSDNDYEDIETEPDDKQANEQNPDKPPKRTSTRTTKNTKVADEVKKIDTRTEKKAPTGQSRGRGRPK